MAQLELRLAAEQQVFAPPLASLVRRPPVTCGEDLSTGAAVRLMRSEGVGSVVVVDQAARPVGILTEHDVVRVLGEELQAAPV